MSSVHRLAARGVAAYDSENHTGQPGCAHCVAALQDMEYLGLIKPGTRTITADTGRASNTSVIESMDNSPLGARYREEPACRDRSAVPEGLRNLPQVSAS